MLPNLMDEERGVANRGLDGGMITEADRAILPIEKSARFEVVRTLDTRDRAIVDEAFLRGASVEEAMGVLIVRRLSRKETGAPAPAYEVDTTRGTKRKSGVSRSRFTREDLLFLENRSLNDIQQRRLNEAEALLPLVVGRYNAYVAHAKSEFDTLPPFVRDSFNPIRGGNCPDPITIATHEDKYRVLRGAYYRAGYTHIYEDVLRYIIPTVFFGVRVEGGTHPSLNELLAQVMNDVIKTKPDIGNQLKAAGFRIGGFVPRFQCASDKLSNHAYGMAIDIDSIWNPQIKTQAAITAFRKATGERTDNLFEFTSKEDSINRIYARINRISIKLQDWLGKWIPKLEQLEAERSKQNNDPKQKAKVIAIDKELKVNPDLAALRTLISEYGKPPVLAWRAYGIITIPREVIESFIRLGRNKGARWGGEYERTKDIMHLELLSFDSLTKHDWPNKPRRRKSVHGLEDLYHPDAYPVPINGPP